MALQQLQSTDISSITGLSVANTAITGTITVSQLDVAFANGTGGMTIPSGTTTQRPPNPTTGMTRFNSTTGYPEWYSSSASSWIQFNSSLPYSVSV